MTTNKHTMALAELAEKGADVDLLREMIRFVTRRLMDMDSAVRSPYRLCRPGRQFQQGNAEATD